jgi:hypothetical protein
MPDDFLLINSEKQNYKVKGHKIVKTFNLTLLRYENDAPMKPGNEFGLALGKYTVWFENWAFLVPLKLLHIIHQLCAESFRSSGSDTYQSISGSHEPHRY